MKVFGEILSVIGFILLVIGWISLAPFVLKPYLHPKYSEYRVAAILVAFFAALFVVAVLYLSVLVKYRIIT